jgi:hypothetical protein
MVKDKGVLSFNEIAEKYKDIEGNPISLSDVQNFCSSGPSYWLNKEDFETDKTVINVQTLKTTILYALSKNLRKMIINELKEKLKDGDNINEFTNKSLLKVLAPAIVCVPVEIKPGLDWSAAVKVKLVPLILPPDA